MSAVVSLHTPELVVPFRAFPRLYGMRVDGDCCAPDIPDGAKCAFDQEAEPKAGDFVCIWSLRTRDGVRSVVPMVKRLCMHLAPWALDRLPYVLGPHENIMPILLFETLNPLQVYQGDLRRVFGIHKCVGISTTDRLTVDLDMLKPPLDPIDRPAKLTRRPRARKGGAQ